MILRQGLADLLVAWEQDRRGVITFEALALLPRLKHAAMAATKETTATTSPPAPQRLSASPQPPVRRPVQAGSSSGSPPPPNGGNPQRGDNKNTSVGIPLHTSVAPTRLSEEVLIGVGDGRSLSPAPSPSSSVFSSPHRALSPVQGRPPADHSPVAERPRSFTAYAYESPPSPFAAAVVPLGARRASRRSSAPSTGSPSGAGLSPPGACTSLPPMSNAPTPAARAPSPVTRLPRGTSSEPPHARSPRVAVIREDNIDDPHGRNDSASPSTDLQPPLASSPLSHRRSRRRTPLVTTGAVANDSLALMGSRILHNASLALTIGSDNDDDLDAFDVADATLAALASEVASRAARRYAHQ